MPFLNSRGDVAHGVGGLPCNVNNVRVAFGGVAGWWDDDTVAFFNGDDAWILSLYHRPTGTIERLDEKYGGPAGGVSGNKGFCSGQKAASWWLGSPDPAVVGLWSTVGLRKPAAGLMGMGPDNAIAYKPDYQSMGPTLYRRPDGSEWEITPGSTDAPCLLGEDRVLWMEGLLPRVKNLPDLKTPFGQQWMGTAAFVAGQWWYCCYSGDHGVILHPFAFVGAGYAVLPKGDAWVTMRALADNVVRVCWADHIGEQAGSIHARDYDVAASLVRDPWGSNAWEPAPLVDVAKINYVPPAVGRASFVLDATSGPVPLNVTATLTQENLTTWRWLLNGEIHHDSEGQADNAVHVFSLPTTGVHTIGMRCVAPAGPVLVPEQIVTVLPKPKPVGWGDFIGVQSGFGVPIGDPTMTELKSRGWGACRIGVNPNINTDPLALSRDLLLQSIAEVQRFGMTPLVLVPPRTVIEGVIVTVPEWVPPGLNVELYGTLPDKPGTGLEPDLLEYSPEAVAAEVDFVMPACRARNHRVWAPCLANFSKDNIEWIRRFCLALKSDDVGIAAHRYMDYNCRRSSDGRRGFKSHDEEIDAFENAIKGRAWAITETSWLAGRHMKWEGGFWKAIAQIPKLRDLCAYVLTENDVAQNFYDDCKLYLKRGASFVVWYQINDGPDRGSWEDCEGLRRYPYELNSWKPVAYIPLRTR